MKRYLPAALIIALFLFPAGNSYAQKLAVTSFVNGLTSPMDIKNCGDSRLFIAERAGRIRVVDGNGVLLPTPMLDITAKVSSVSCEEGFLGMAFSPNHATDRKLYVNYTATLGGQLHTVIEEYKVSTANNNVVDPASALELMRIPQPFCNHNGGNMMFGKDGYLYIAMGDGGSGGDPQNNGQSLTTWLGKMLRIDISNSSTAQPYAVPTSNPFYNSTNSLVKKEIWAYGLRNPFRASVDRITGDIWIGDVGQGAREEIDYQPYSSTGGVNYGWKHMEGTACYSPSTGCITAGMQLPIHDYGRSNGYSVTGGYVHRSAQSKFLFGTYLFSDFGFKWIDGLRQANGAVSGSVMRLLDGSLAPGSPVGYGEDMYGDLYIAYINLSTVYKITDTSYIRQPKAYIQSSTQSGSDYMLKAMQGRNVTYRWFKNGAPIPGAVSPEFTTTGPGTYQLELTNELSRKDTSEPFSLTPLAVTLVDFYARRSTDNNVELTWNTMSEQNNAGFEVERRKSSESDFRPIASIPTMSVNGNSSSKLQYQFTDMNSGSSEKIFYRLKMFNRDNSFKYSEVRMVNAGNGKGYTIYPNPAKGNAILNLSSAELPVKLNIYDMTGRIILSQVINVPQFRLDLTKMKGSYLIEIFDRNERLSTEKLIVE